MTTAEIMLKLIRSEITGQKSDEGVVALITPAVAADVYTLSQKHDLAHVVGSALHKAGALGADDVSNNFTNRMFMATVRYENQTYELQKICELFEEQKIEHCPLKGSVIRAYYPEPWMRTCCDIDILVKECDLKKAADCLKSSLGYGQETIGAHDISLHSPSGIHLELHHTLMEVDRYARIPEILARVWEYTDAVEGYAFQKRIRAEMFAFYHIVHMVWHFLNGGCGVRPFMDLWLLNRSSAYDFSATNPLLAEADLITFSEKALALSQVWFSDEETDEVINAMQEFILFGGVYGNTSNRVLIQQVKIGGNSKYLLSRIFLPYRFLKYQYPIIQKHKWLTPFCEICRWVKLVFNGGVKRSQQEFGANSNISVEDSKNAEILLLKLGLQQT